MGFSVTATHAIFFIAFLTAGSTGMAAYWESVEDLDEGRRGAEKRVVERAHTAISIPSDPSYSSGADRLTFFIDNDGTVVLDASDFTYVVDGVVRTDVRSGYPRVNGAQTDVLLPGDRMEVQLNSIAASPDYLWVMTGNGISAFRRW